MKKIPNAPIAPGKIIDWYVFTQFRPDMMMNNGTRMACIGIIIVSNAKLNNLSRPGKRNLAYARPASEQKKRLEAVTVNAIKKLLPVMRRIGHSLKMTR